MSSLPSPATSASSSASSTEDSSLGMGTRSDIRTNLTAVPSRPRVQYVASNHRSIRQGAPLRQSNLSQFHNRPYHRNHMPINKPSDSSGCPKSIFYLYLLAIMSSVMIVVGIYYALTRFNANYLAISLSGLCLITVGACIYFLYHIKLNRNARRKNNLRDVCDSIDNQWAHVMSRGTMQSSNITSQNLATLGSVNSRAPLVIDGNSSSNNVLHSSTTKPGPLLGIALEPFSPPSGVEIANQSARASNNELIALNQYLSGTKSEEKYLDPIEEQTKRIPQSNQSFRNKSNETCNMSIEPSNSVQSCETVLKTLSGPTLVKDECETKPNPTSGNSYWRADDFDDEPVPSTSQMNQETTRQDPDQDKPRHSIETEATNSCHPEDTRSSSIILLMEGEVENLDVDEADIANMSMPPPSYESLMGQLSLK